MNSQDQRIARVFAVVCGVIALIAFAGIHTYSNSASPETTGGKMALALVATAIPVTILLCIATIVEPRILMALSEKNTEASPLLRVVAIVLGLVGIVLGVLLASYYRGNPLLNLL